MLQPRRQRSPSSGLEILSMTQAAALTKSSSGSQWSRKRMLRHLLAANKELGGMLLVKTGEGQGARYTVARAALEKLHPQWFENVTSLRSELAAAQDKIEEHDEMLTLAHRSLGRLSPVARWMGEMKKMCEDLARRVEALEKRRAA